MSKTIKYESLQRELQEGKRFERLINESIVNLTLKVIKERLNQSIIPKPQQRLIIAYYWRSLENSWDLVDLKEIKRRLNVSLTWKSIFSSYLQTNRVLNEEIYLKDKLIMSNKAIVGFKLVLNDVYLDDLVNDSKYDLFNNLCLILSDLINRLKIFFNSEIYNKETLQQEFLVAFDYELSFIISSNTEHQELRHLWQRVEFHNDFSKLKKSIENLKILDNYKVETPLLSEADFNETKMLKIYVKVCLQDKNFFNEDYNQRPNLYLLYF